MYKAFIVSILFFAAWHVQAQNFTVEQVRKDFTVLLQRPAVDPKPTLQIIATDSVIIEKGLFYTEVSEKVPLLIYKPISKETKKFPVVICLHGTGGSKDEATIKNLLMRFVKAGYIGVAIDARFHGERATNGRNSYTDAIVTAWRNNDTARLQHPFFYDTVYDIWKLVDYLITRPDLDSNRIGITGISMGGIETWLAASVDQRIKVAVPIIGVQSFKWSLQHDQWQGRANTISAAHVQVAKDLGDSVINKENVSALWDKILSGITNEFDCPSMIRLFAPRPLLILNTEKDKNCPLGGAQIAFAAATKAYKSKKASDHLSIYVEPNEPHKFTSKHLDLLMEWLKKWL